MKKNLGLLMELGSRSSPGKKGSSSSSSACTSGQNLKQECVYQYEVEQPLLLRLEPASVVAANSRPSEAVMTHFLDGSSNSTIKSVAITTC